MKTYLIRTLLASGLFAIHFASPPVACAQGGSCVPPPAGLVSWWKAENNAVDAVGGNHGVASNVVYSGGEIGQAFVFDGITSSITIPAAASLNVQNLTLEGWINPTDVSSQAPIAEYGSGTTWSGVHLWISVPMGGGPGTLFANLRSLASGLDQNIISSAPGLIPSNQWSHVALTYDQASGMARLYINGTNVATRNLGSLVPDTAQPLNIGMRPVGVEGGSGLRFPGLIDELSLYNRALSDSEITAIYTAGSAGKCAPASPPICTPSPANLVSWWKAENNAVDLVGGNNGTLQGGTTFAAGEVGQAFNFNGSDSYVQVPDAPSLRLTSELTVEFWIKRQQLTDDYIVNKGGDWTDGALNYGVGIAGPSNGNVLHFLYANGLQGTISITDFNWHHCAVTARHGDANATFYVDGVQQPVLLRKGPATINLYPSTAPLLIGAQVAPIANYFSGALVDELSLYSRVLTAAEIQAIYTAGSAGKSASLASSVPVISNIIPATGAIGETITISGNNFSATPAGNIVYFGAVRASVLTASATSLTVAVPPGATFAPITVNVNGLVAYSSKPFQPGFVGNGSNLDLGSFAPGFNLAAGDGPGSMVIADLDGDGKPDLAEVNGAGHTVSVYRNLSTTGVLNTNSFAPRVDLALPVVGNGGDPYRLCAADLDGDGKLDLLACEVSGSRVSVFRNISTPGSLTTGSFAAPVSLSVGADARFSAAADLDADGRTDIVALNFGDSTISILKNIGAPGSLTADSFAAPVNLAAPAGSGPYEVGIGDLDGDGKPDLAVANAYVASISVFRNVGTPGILDVNSFASRVDFPSQNRGTTIALGDLDGDGKLDLVVGFVEPQAISVYRNLSSPGTFNSGSLAAPVDFSLPGWGHTVALTDFNGDGRLDIAVVGELSSYFAVFQNLSTPGSFTAASLAARVDFPTGWNAWGVAVGDLDGDGRPDSVFCNAYNANLTIYQNLVSFGGPLFITAQPADQAVSVGGSATFSVVAGGAAPLSYQWLINGTNLAGETNATLTVANVQYPQSGSVYSVSITNTSGAILSSNAVLTVRNATPQISMIASLHTPISTATAPIAFTVRDAETPADLLVVTRFSSNPTLVPTNQIILSGTGSNRFVTVTPAANQVGSATIILRVMDELGAMSSMGFTLTVDQFTQLPLTLPSITLGAVAWGDYDNDSRLDLLISGTTNGLASGAITRIYHNDSGAFTNFISLTNVLQSAVAWGDYDRDGYLDVTVSGINRSNTPATRLYHNNGNGTFADINAGLTGVYNGSIAWGDFNNDGASDLFLCGLITNNVVRGATNFAALYRNDGNGVFTDMNTALPGPNNGSAAWGDYDNDGRPDLLLVGSFNSQFSPGNSSIGNIYRNLGNGSFSNITAQSFGYYYGGSAAWGDYDNDGRLDFAVFNGVTGGSYIYHNNGNNSFTTVANFAIVTWPQIAWGDYDNDGRLDLLIGGTTTYLYRNNSGITFMNTQAGWPATTTRSGVAWGDFDNDGDLDAIFMSNPVKLLRNNITSFNTPPAPPAHLAVAIIALTNTVVLTWSKPFDAQTSSNGLNYNLRVGTTPGGVDVVSPLADPVTGQRRVAALGNAGPTNRALFVNLPQGTYYWSVQAIDTSFAGSAFQSAPTAVEGTFTIMNARPVISDIPDLTIAPGTNSSGPVMPFVIGDLETKASSLVVTARSSNTNVVALTNIVFGGSGSNRTVRVAARTNGIAVITITVADAQGAFASDNFTVRSVKAEPFTLVSTNFIQVEESIVAWGDYNNDGRLDVLIAGNTNGSTALPPVTRLYHNSSNGMFMPVAATLPNVTLGSAAWGDSSNDGRLDLLLTGTTNGLASGAISRIYWNDGQGNFPPLIAVLPGVYYSAVAWGDYDNDGRADILITGTTNGLASGAISRLYRNFGSFITPVSFTGVYQGAVAFTDLDGDGDLDVVIAGLSASSTGIAQVYRNNGDRSFTLMPSSLTGVYDCSLSIGDFDNDGRPDILLAGYTGSSYLSRVYRNNGNFSFTDIAAGLPGVSYASTAWGDFDNDGRLDILLSGATNGWSVVGLTRVYRNTGSAILSQSFSNYPVSLPTNYLGAVTWADFDKDGDLDILLTGTDGTFTGQNYPRSRTALYRNNAGVSNTPPTAPASLVSIRSNNVVALNWAKATDAQTRTVLAGAPITNYNGLKYQIRVGTTPGGIETESPLADLSTGYRRVVRTGDASTNRWQLRNLPPGTYYWSVQAIDTAFAGSPFSAENSFVVTRPPVVVTDAVSTPTNIPANFPTAKLTLNDLSPDGYPLTVISVSPISLRGGTVSLASARVTYTPPTDFSGNDSFTYTVSDGLGGTATGTVIVTVGNGGLISLNIVSGPLVDGGDFVVRFAGIPGFTYTIETADTLTGPWVKVGNLTAPTTDTGFGVGVFEFRESMDANLTRFYRTVYPAY